MLLFQWNSELETGIALIDQQHRELITQANSLLLRNKCGNIQEDLPQYLEFFHLYTLYHFQAEEAFQMSSDYPGRLGHQASHKALATEMKFHMVRLEKSASPAEVGLFCEFVAKWVQNHILVEDLTFARHYHAWLGQE